MPRSNLKRDLPKAPLSAEGKTLQRGSVEAGSFISYGKCSRELIGRIQFEQPPTRGDM